MLPLTKKELKLHQVATVCYICGKRFPQMFVDGKKYRKVRDHYHFTSKYRGAAHSICNLRYNVPKETPVVFHNGSNYDDQFIVNELANMFERQFECLWETQKSSKLFPFQ